MTSPMKLKITEGNDQDAQTRLGKVRLTVTAASKLWKHEYKQLKRKYSTPM